MGVKDADRVPHLDGSKEQFPPAPPGWDEDTAESYEHRFRNPSGTAPLARPDAEEGAEAPAPAPAPRGSEGGEGLDEGRVGGGVTSAAGKSPPPAGKAVRGLAGGVGRRRSGVQRTWHATRTGC